MSKANTASLTPDRGRLLENAVFLHLRKKADAIYYYRSNSECDFLVKKQGEIKQAVQVCYQLNEDNVKKEITGLKEAMKAVNISEGLIITFNQKDNMEGISVIPAWEFIE